MSDQSCVDNHWRVSVEHGTAASRDFESVRRTHEEFLTNMADCCFLHERVRGASIHTLLPGIQYTRLPLG